MKKVKKEEIGKAVRERYGNIAKQDSSCCGPVKSCCEGTDVAQDISRKIGYTEEELNAVPEGANLGLGCGNPVALASLKKGEVVLDLGSGAGFDCFLAANQVGKTGKVIGVDMTPEMLDRARANARKGNYENVEFRLGEIENLPVADDHADIIISNCVINLSPDKKRVFQEAFRVLKPGGRLMVSDIVLLKELPDEIKNSVAAYVSCLAGALTKDNYLAAIQAAGFREIKIIDEATFPAELLSNDPSAREIIKNLNLSKEKARDLARSVLSMNVSALKPAARKGKS
jgi:arsenite methyltransferase